MPKNEDGSTVGRGGGVGGYLQTNVIRVPAVFVFDELRRMELWPDAIPRISHMEKCGRRPWSSSSSPRGGDPTRTTTERDDDDDEFVLLGPSRRHVRLSPSNAQRHVGHQDALHIRRSGLGGRRPPILYYHVQLTRLYQNHHLLSGTKYSK